MDKKTYDEMRKAKECQTVFPLGPLTRPKVAQVVVKVSTIIFPEEPEAGEGGKRTTISLIPNPDTKGTEQEWDYTDIELKFGCQEGGDAAGCQNNWYTILPKPVGMHGPTFELDDDGYITSVDFHIDGIVDKLKNAPQIMQQYHQSTVPVRSIVNNDEGTKSFPEATYGYTDNT